jgi:8-oxo-dGTP pyrophosphatase MutT (NUDIX family)
MLIRQEPIYQGKVVRLTIDEVRLPNGKQIPLEIVHHPGGAAVAAIDAQQRICLLRQFRHAAGGYIHELPAGKLEPNEPPQLTAERELAEEAAVHATEWHALGHYVSSPGVFTEVIHLYLATGLKPTDGAPESNEVFEIEWWPLALAVERALSEGLRDGKTALGILRAAAKLGFFGGKA